MYTTKQAKYNAVQMHANYHGYAILILQTEPGQIFLQCNCDNQYKGTFI
jgi:hypothetical protein